MATQIAIRGRWDRVRYTLMFEMSLIGMIAPTMAWVLEKGVTNTGLLALVLSLKAMVFNILYNCAFDLVDVHYGRVPTQRSFKGRALHALGFELLLTVTTLPIIIWWLGLSFMQALMIDLVLVAGVLLYTMVFTRIYDAVFPVTQPILEGGISPSDSC